MPVQEMFENKHPDEQQQDYRGQKDVSRYMPAVRFEPVVDERAGAENPALRSDKRQEQFLQKH